MKPEQKNIFDEKIKLYEGINTHLLPYIPEGSLVLDVGCGTGLLGERLKKFKRCTVFGIDISKTAIEEASLRLDRAEAMDVENMDFPFEDTKFDVIVFGDVLEHLKDPETILKFYSTFLEKEGHIVTSIPNVANILIRIKLLLGKWKYTQNGILDATHIRFFTLRSIWELVEKANLDIKKCTHIPGAYLLRWQKIKLVADFEKWLSRMRPTLFATQFIFQLGLKK